MAPRQFIFRAGEAEQQRCPDGAQAAYEAFQAYADEHADAESLRIEDEAAGEALVLLLTRGAVARTRAVAGSAEPHTEYCAVARPTLYGRFVMRFLEDGYAGVDHSGLWLRELADLDAPPEEQGERRAAAVSTEREALDEVLRMWSDSGYVDPTDQYYVFFDTHTLEMSRAERAELLALVGRLGLERADPPAGAASGEVWVRKDERLEAELEQWS
ncbi:hypothetical protein DT076_15235 [Desertihabitans brevis]|uniref:Uncharacterized protein n=1 Tax=Desertihabitans brevis TaxID=2268447 RepID=A0A367YU81_9ACTN|nr:hypothetical protein DT076_15235 [Desertihabitans brevis]